MTLPSSFPLSANQIDVELARASGAAMSLLGAQELALAGKAGAPVSFSDFLGKSSLLVEQVDKRTFISGANPHVFTACNFGATAGRTGIIALVQHGDVGSDPGLNPTCTIGGVVASRYQPRSTGTGSGDATGSAIFIANPTGLSGDISVDWANSFLRVGLIVLRVVGYNIIPSQTFGGSASFGDNSGSKALTLSAKDTVIAVKGSGFSSAATVWTGITSRLDELDQGAGADNRRSYAFDYNVAGGATTISVSPYSQSLGYSSWSGIVLNAN